LSKSRVVREVFHHRDTETQRRELREEEKGMRGMRTEVREMNSKRKAGRSPLSAILISVFIPTIP
jgi:hypothetical protein